MSSKSLPRTASTKSPTIEIATALGLAFYDALFLALAKERDLPLVTSDSSQVEAAKKLELGVQFTE